MKLIKKLFMGICVCIILCCGAVLVCALSPGLTEKISQTLYGEGGPMEGAAGSGNTADGASSDSALLFVLEDGDVADGVIRDGQARDYTADGQGTLSLPGGVSGRSGLQPVAEQGEELADAQADELGSSVGTGETGDDLTFDAETYPYYQMLNTQMRHVYRQIYANANALTESFAPVETVTSDQLKNVFEAVCNDHPELFWLDTSFSCKYRANGAVVEMTLSFNETADNLDQTRETFESAASQIASAASGKTTVLEQETAVHDALLRSVSYADGAAMNQSAYSALVNGQTVCAGYARAFQYVCQQLGITCYYCTGYSGENHAWNIVKLDDGYTNVDVTWDDTDPATYDYFNKTDAEYAATHVRTGLSVYLPACGAGGADTETDAADATVGTSNTETDNGSETETGTEESTADASDDWLSQYINSNPTTPMDYVPKEKKDDTAQTGTSGSFVSGGDVYDITAAGVTESAVLDTLDKYYADCLKQLTALGSGEQHFNNVVPKYVLESVESAYGTGAYKTGYVNSALEKLGCGSFSLQIQVEELGGNYYRLYHNVVTW